MYILPCAPLGSAKEGTHQRVSKPSNPCFETAALPSRETVECLRHILNSRHGHLDERIARIEKILLQAPRSVDSGTCNPTLGR